MEKLTVLIPETKKTPITAAVVNSEIVTFKTRQGKKVSIPRTSLLLLEEKTIIYVLPRRKIIKGTFKAVEGGLEDKASGIFVAKQCFVESVTEKAASGKKVKVEKSNGKKGTKKKKK